MSPITSDVQPQIIALDNGRFGCTLCTSTISRKGDFKRHTLTHLPSKDKTGLKCEHPGCSFVTLQKSNLKTHMDTHLNERNHRCELCHFRCNDPGSLIRHRRNRHNIAAKSSQASSKAQSQKKTQPSGRFAPYARPVEAAASTGNTSSSSAISTDSLSPVFPAVSAFPAFTPETATFEFFSNEAQQCEITNMDFLTPWAFSAEQFMGGFEQNSQLVPAVAAPSTSGSPVLLQNDFDAFQRAHGESQTQAPFYPPVESQLELYTPAISPSSTLVNGFPSPCSSISTLAESLESFPELENVPVVSACADFSFEEILHPEVALESSFQACSPLSLEFGTEFDFSTQSFEFQ